MNKLVCELCGCNDLVKQEGFFICQACGTKYTVEEARKMMIEGTVDVSGSTVKVDTSAAVEKYLANARRAKQKEDWEETEKYYNLVEQNDPTNIEAIFYSAYGKAKTSLTDEDIYKRQAVFKVLQNCVSIIDDNYNMEKAEELKPIIIQITQDIMTMACSNYVYTKWTNGYGNVTRTNKGETEQLFLNLISEWITSLLNITNKYPQNAKEQIEYIYYLVIKLREFTRDNMDVTNESKNNYNETIVLMHQQIKKIHPEHEVPEFETVKDSISSGGVIVIMATIIIGIIIIVAVATSI